MIIARNMILGKVHNQRYVIERARRDYALRLDCEKLENASKLLKQSMSYIKDCKTLDELRGYEGEAASVYFRVFDDLILQNKHQFVFSGRNKRPPAPFSSS